jgi:hypothetical protein
MLTLFVLPALVMTAEPKWEKAADTGGVTVLRRDKEGTPVKEVKATSVFNSSPKAVWAVINDLANYAEFMPYTAEAKVLERSADGKEVVSYQRLQAPIVSERDYIIKLRDESTTTDDGKTGYYKVSWSALPTEKDTMMPEKKDVVRVRINDGYWQLEGNADSSKTFATYYVYTAPGGSVPTFVINVANTEAVPKVFESIRKRLAAKAK